MRNVLLNKRKKRFYLPGGITDLVGNNPNQTDWINAGNTFDNTQTVPTKPQSVLDEEKRWNIKYDPIQKPDNPIASETTQTPSAPKTDWSGKISGGLQIAEAGIGGAINGSNNWNKGKVQTQEGQYNFINNQANNVSQSYTAGQNKLNLLSRVGSAATADDLKTHKGWTNILGSTAKGAMAGASMGGAYGAIIGGAVGLIGSSLGELFGRDKREKEARRLKELQKEADYAVAYHNSRQAEQLASANDNAAKAQADSNRRSVLALAAYGGKLKRRNYLI